MALDRVTTRYEQEGLDDLKKELEAIIEKHVQIDKGAKKMGDSITKGASEGKDAVDKTTKSVEGFQKQLDKLVGIAAGAFATDKIISFGKEAVSLAARLEGVEAAFNDLNRPNLLANLRDATRGTVSDLQLMQQAVQAKNFKIPLEKLAGFFEFARRRAKATGESVEFLTQSIITGIGRKSPLILDNLGISASELSEEFKRVGDFGVAAGNIIEQELQGMGEDIETTQEALDRFTASWENLQVKAGQTLISIANSIAELQRQQSALDKQVEEDLPKILRLADAIGSSDLPLAISDIIFEVGKGQQQLTLLGNSLFNQIDLLEKAAEASMSFGTGLSELISIADDGTVSLTALGESIFKTLGFLQDQQKEVREIIRNEAFLTKEIQDRLDERKEELTTIERTKVLNQEIKDLQEELNELLDKERDKKKKLFTDTIKVRQAQFNALDAEIRARLELDELIANSEEERIQAVINRTNFELENEGLTISQRELLIAEGQQRINDILELGAEQAAFATNKALVEGAVQTREDLGEIWSAASDDVENSFKDLGAKVTKIVDQLQSLAFLAIDTIAAFQEREAQRAINSIEDGAAAQRKQIEREIQDEEEKAEALRLLQERVDQQTEQAQREAFEKNKKLRVAEASIDAAGAILKTLASVPFPFNLVAAALIGVKTSFEIDTINEQRFAEGTEFVQGPGGHKQDLIPARLSRGERVVNYEDNMRYWNPLESMRHHNFEKEYLHVSDVHGMMIAQEREVDKRAMTMAERMYQGTKQMMLADPSIVKAIKKNKSVSINNFHEMPRVATNPRA